jgi:hypothetical protein
MQNLIFLGNWGIPKWGDILGYPPKSSSGIDPCSKFPIRVPYLDRMMLLFLNSVHYSSLGSVTDDKL